MGGEYDPNFVYEPVYAVVGGKVVVQHEDGEILFMRRSEKCTGAGNWDYPGGGIDKGEDPIEGIMRETEEEAGIKLRAVRPVYVFSSIVDDKFTVMIGYSALTDEKEIDLSWEHDKYLWLPKDKALELELDEKKRLMLEKHFEFGFGKSDGSN